MNDPVVFVHGVGRAAADAWPLQASDAPENWMFLRRRSISDSPEEDAQRILELLGSSGSGHLVAHSYGAIAAILVARQRPEWVETLTLIEPACFDLARGCPAVEEHIAAMEPVFAVRDDPTVSSREFSRRFAQAMGTQPPDLPDDVLEERVGRLRATPQPWGTSLAAQSDLPARTVVLTGGWSDLYEEVAESLVQRGAVHEQLTGYGHRVQDHPDATALMAQHWTAPGLGSRGVSNDAGRAREH